MIVSLRGTNGSGKSTIVRKIMKLYDFEHRVYEEGRKKPLSTMLRKSTVFPFELMVPGHYEIANGGVDTLPSLDYAYELIRLAAEKKVHVLYEGKNMSDSAKRVIALRDAGFPVSVVAIDIKTSDAVASVRARGHKIKKETVEKLNLKTAKEVVAFEKAGVPVWYLDRAKAFKKVKQLLGA